jgi:hypothetical protein
VIGQLYPGQRVKLSTDSEHAGENVIIWSAAPGPGCYWAHLPDHNVVHIQVRNRIDRETLHVIIREDLIP